MLLTRGIFFLVAMSYVVCQMPSEAEKTTSKRLEIIEMRQVMRQDDPSGKNHNIKVILSPHDPLLHVVEWNLAFLKDGEVTSYTLKGDGQDPTTQTEFIFEGNLVESEFVTVYAKNATGAVGIATYAVPITDLKSDIAWVGDYKTGKSSSLRVSPGGLVKSVEVDQHHFCEYSNSPCYYITPSPQPTNIERCYYPIPQMKLCDDRVISFNEPSSLPALFLKDNTFLEVEAIFNGELPLFEVVAYDPQDHTQVFSTYPYRCHFPTGAEWNEGDNIRCGVRLSSPANTTAMMVLVVKLGEDGDVMESSLLTYGDGSPIPPSSNTGVIVGAVFGTLIGLAVIIILIVCCMKKKDEKRAKTDRGGSAVYRTTTTTDPAEA